jgi:hypothetical protein
MSRQDITMLSLANLKEGAAVEAFDEELKKVVENILDPNTTRKTRTITLKVDITPGKRERKRCFYRMHCFSTTAPNEPIEGDMVVGVDSEGKAAAREIIQGSFDFGDEGEGGEETGDQAQGSDPAKVRELRAGRESAS